MLNDFTVPDESYSLFVNEANDLLQVIEQELLTLKDDRTLPKVHNLMRAAHTLKGAASSLGLETMKRIAHALEDVFKSFYNPEVVIDTELESLLFQGYECLRLCLEEANTWTLGLDLEMQPSEDILNHIATIITQLQTKLGDVFDQDVALPTSEELGFDITQSIFESGVQERLARLAEILSTTTDNTQVGAELRNHTEVFLGLAESLNLLGWGAIANATLTALDAHPNQAIAIAKAALTDFKQGHAAVLAGDRTQGGNLSLELKRLAGMVSEPSGEGLDDLPDLFNDFHFYSDSAPDNNTDLFPATESDQKSNKPKLSNTFSSFASELIDFSVNPEELSPFLDDHDSAQELSGGSNLSSNLTLKEISGGSHPASKPIASKVDPLFSQEFTLMTDASQTSLPLTQSMIRVRVGQLEQLNHLSGELLTNQNKQTAEVEQAQKLIREVLQLAQAQQQTLNSTQDWADQRRLGHGHAHWQTHTSERHRESYPSIQTGHPSASALTLLTTALSVSPQFDLLELDHYSELDLLLQSALEQRTQIEAIAEQLFLLIQQSSRSLEKQQRLLTEVRDDLTLARMQPLGEVLNRFKRVLQQLISARQKPVNLLLQGTEVLVERAIADKLYDPLLHLIRNAFDHGIEEPEDRRKLNKPEVGQIQIRAHQKGNRTVIEVQDDGRGLNFQRIRQRAVELNLLSQEQAAYLAEAQLVELLFEPGFSTVSKLTDLSGRGIGLDVVLSQIRALNGSVTVQSQAHRGTVFSLHLPSTLTITKLMLCQANQVTYALTMDAIDQIVLPHPQQIHKMSGQKALFWHKENTEYLIPIWNLSDLILYSTTPKHHLRQTSNYLPPTRQVLGQSLAQANQSSTIVLVSFGTQLLGLEVDQVLGEQELVIRPLSKTIPPPKYIYGSSVLSNSSLALVIDPASLIAEHHSSQSVKEMESPRPIQPNPKHNSHSTYKAQLTLRSPNFIFGSSAQTASLPTVLVVDDSATIRQTLSTLLQRSGYQVMQAMDGIEALEYLQQQVDGQIGVICDLEMPRMNGFEFLNQCRQNSALSRFPVIVLTSRTGAKHRQLALELGAVAYLTKPYTPNELLTLLTQVI